MKPSATRPHWMFGFNGARLCRGDQPPRIRISSVVSKPSASFASLPLRLVLGGHSRAPVEINHAAKLRCD